MDVGRRDNASAMTQTPSIQAASASATAGHRVESGCVIKTCIPRPVGPQLAAVWCSCSLFSHEGDVSYKVICYHKRCADYKISLLESILELCIKYSTKIENTAKIHHDKGGACLCVSKIMSLCLFCSLFASLNKASYYYHYVYTSMYSTRVTASDLCT